MVNKLNNSDIPTLIEMYNKKEKTATIAKYFNVTGATIHNYLKNNVNNFEPTFSRRKYSINDNYFEKIDTEDKAYFLGLLYADGNVYLKTNRIKLSLVEKDKDILEKFKKLIESNNPITYYNRTNKNENWQNVYEFAFTSKKVTNDLIKLGCIPRKTYFLKFPTEEQVPSHLIHHFIRGYFDGDGCVLITKKYKNLNIRFDGTIEFLSSLQQYISTKLNLPINKLGKRHKDRVDNIYNLSYGGNILCKKLFNLFYNNANLYLDRKYKIFKSIYL